MGQFQFSLDRVQLDQGISRYLSDPRNSSSTCWVYHVLPISLQESATGYSLIVLGGVSNHEHAGSGGYINGATALRSVHACIHDFGGTAGHTAGDNAKEAAKNYEMVACGGGCYSFCMGCPKMIDEDSLVRSS